MDAQGGILERAAPTAAWPRGELSAQELKAIDTCIWHVFTRETVIEIIGAWNGGMTTAAMAKDLGCKPGSIRILIGRLTQLGISMRRATRSPTPAMGPRIVRAEKARAPAMSPEAEARLRRLAPFDGAARRALERYLKDRG